MDYDPEGSGEGDEEIFEPFSGRNGAICLIDCSERSFVNEAQFFKEGFLVIRSMMLNGIIASEKDMVGSLYLALLGSFFRKALNFQLGIVFFNVEHSPPPTEEKDKEATDCTYKNVAVFMNLKQTSADSVKFINNFIKNDFFDFPARYGHTETNAHSLTDALWLSSKMFKSADYKLQEKVIFLLTARPDPFVRGSDDEKGAFKKAKDLQDSGISLEIVPLCDDFDLQPFYGQFSEIVMGEPLTWDQMKPKDIRDRLKQRTFCPNFKKRPLNKVKMTIAEGIELSVALYATSRKAKPPPKVALTKDTGEVITTKMVHEIPVETAGPAAAMEVDEGSVELRAVLPSDQSRYVEVGGEKVVFTNHEYLQTKRLMESGIKLIGFRPAEDVQATLHLRSPLFIYPHEENVKGSMELFTALWMKCKELNQVGFALLVSRQGAHPKKVYLVPQEAFESGHYARSDGFRVHFIPYVTNIRSLDFLKATDFSDSTPEEVALMKKVVKGLRVKYVPEAFENPNVTTKYAQIEATILDEELEPMTDTTMPVLSAQDERLENLMEEFEGLFGEDVAVAEKRKPTKATAPRAKVQKTTDPAEVINSYKNGKLEKLTVDQLKAFLTEHGEGGLSKLKKSDLVVRVNEVIEDKGLA